MARFRDINTLQMFAAAQSSNHSHVNHQPNLNLGQILTQLRAAFVEWRRLAPLW